MQRSNVGTLNFYRDSKGNEIDIIYEMGRDVYPIEVKAGATVANEFFKNIRNFFKIYPHTPYGGALIYGGKEPQLRTDIKVFTVWMIEEMIENIK
ncbi:DUF4143 domain-containing protein [Deferribacterales bacterium Es71-Z0220]|uniref:DUF4143 domain-containing protein n=1 Tax=Deferrivibrio essentukiensis TaxID=2880922 RepID=UPI001F61B675|nr:DUF4143 domain-containing protein [Deferrivibrio essentukiensis]MCB4205447.1 DUF4143 domain-containing protein [Deferrivibrio essentukiensis]